MEITKTSFQTEDPKTQLALLLTNKYMHNYVGFRCVNIIWRAHQKDIIIIFRIHLYTYIQQILSNIY